jgi:hypothetical protein
MFFTWSKDCGKGELRGGERRLMFSETDCARIGIRHMGNPKQPGRSPDADIVHRGLPPGTESQS